MANEKLVGTWKLVSASSTAFTGERIEAPCGRQNDLTDQLRWPKAAFFWRRDSLATGEQAEAFNTFLAYAARYTLSDDKVTHHVGISSIQNYVNKDMVRGIKFEGDRIKAGNTASGGERKRNIDIIINHLQLDARRNDPARWISKGVTSAR
jgi:hypothetical protein